MSLSLAMILATAAPFADLDAIDRQVAEFTGAEAGMAGGATAPVDRRLRLRRCASPLMLSWRTQRRESVVVQCPDAGGWRIFVPAIGSGGGAAALPSVNRGDAVTIAVTGEGFTVSQPGEALESGPVGAWIRVRSLTASRGLTDAMRAKVIRPGVVGIPLQ